MGLRLVDAVGREVWASAGRPVLDAYPSTLWQAGEIVRDPHPLAVAGLPSGRYRLMLSAGQAPWTDLEQVVIP